jgi:hypothetical protein
MVLIVAAMIYFSIVVVTVSNEIMKASVAHVPILVPLRLSVYGSLLPATNLKI